MDISNIEKLIQETYTKKEYPVLAWQIENWRKEQPLKGVSVIDAAPVFRNTLIKHLALIAAGAKLIVGLSHLLPYDEKIAKLITSSGIQVIHSTDRISETDIILDCAGAFSQWPARIGYVELTRSGVDAYANCNKPVFIADSGKIKQIETCLGTGESYFRAMQKLGYTGWKDKKLVVFGSGKVGTGIITYAHSKGADVFVVTDLNHVTPLIKSKATAIIDYRDFDKVNSIIADAYAVVTATGVKNALEDNIDPKILIQSNALLANMGVEDEFGSSIPKERVLENKRTLNFILDEPTHLKYIETTMALHNEGAVYVSEHPAEKGLITPSSQLEEKLLNICRKNGCIDNNELEAIQI